MSQEILNHVTVLHVVLHKERLDTVNTDKLTDEFVSRMITDVPFSGR